MHNEPVQVGHALGPVARGLVARHLRATGSTLSVADVVRLGAAGELPAELKTMYDEVGAYL
jgi:hypothetical protein